MYSRTKSNCAEANHFDLWCIVSYLFQTLSHLFRPQAAHNRAHFHLFVVSYVYQNEFSRISPFSNLFNTCRRYVGEPRIHPLQQFLRCKSLLRVARHCRSILRVPRPIPRDDNTTFTTLASSTWCLGCSSFK